LVLILGAHHWCSSLVLIIGAHHWCSSLVLIIGAHHWCSSLVLIIGAHHWCSSLVLIIGAHHWCSSLVLIIGAHHWCGQDLATWGAKGEDALFYYYFRMEKRSVRGAFKVIERRNSAGMQTNLKSRPLHEKLEQVCQC
jgi:hypothetical protein